MLNQLAPIFVLLSFYKNVVAKREDLRIISPEIKICLDNCVEDKECFSVNRLLAEEYPADYDSCSLCFGEVCRDPTTPFDLDCIYQARDTCNISCPDALGRRLQTCHICRRKCIPSGTKKKIIKMSECLTKCKNSTDCRNDVTLSRECNQCIYDTCHGRSGPGCSVYAQCNCHSCLEPVISYRIAMTCRRCYMECGAGVAGGPAKYFDESELTETT